MSFQAGHVCGDDLDLIEGQPTDCVGVSFGFASTMSDVINVINFTENCFVQGRDRIDVLRQFELIAAESCEGIRKEITDSNKSETQGEDTG